MEDLASEAKPSHAVFPVGTMTKPLTCAPDHTFQSHSLQMILWGASLHTSPILSWSCYKLSPHNKNSGKMDHQTAHLIVTSFIGQLKSWWDHYLNNSDVLNILSAVKKEFDGTIIVLDNHPSQDAVNTLIFAITKHFVGEPIQ